MLLKGAVICNPQVDLAKTTRKVDKPRTFQRISDAFTKFLCSICCSSITNTFFNMLECLNVYVYKCLYVSSNPGENLSKIFKDP